MLLKPLFFYGLLSLSVMALLSSCSITESQPESASAAASKDEQKVESNADKASPQQVDKQSSANTETQKTTQISGARKKDEVSTTASTTAVTATAAGSEPQAPTNIQTKTDKKPVPVISSATTTAKPQQQEPLKTTKKSTAVKTPIAKTGSLNGNIVILGKNNKSMAADDTVISLEPLFKIKAPSAHKKQQHKILMQGKSYNPALLNIHVDDTVVFKNRDTIKHNVFSPSADNSFDLGTYGFGKSNQVSFNKAGIAKVYCNIHPDMATFIAISDSGYSEIVDKNGKFSMAGLPAGEYQLTAWNFRGQLSRKVVVKAGQPTQVSLQLKTAAYKKTQHKNKHGKSYKVQPSIFEDEFY